MTSAAAKFLFDLDFAPGAAEREVAPADHAIAIAEAESRGFRDGFAAAEREGTAEAQRRSTLAFEQIGDAMSRLGRGLAAIEARLEVDAVELAATVGRKLAPALIAQTPMAEIEALARDCFKQLVATPHVVVRVGDAAQAQTRPRIEEIARLRGFDGRLVILAEPELADGDCVIEWADGGIVRNRAQTDALIADAVSRFAAGRIAPLESGDQP